MRLFAHHARLPPPSPCRPASANWLKLRAFGLTQYDAVLLVDPSQRVAGDLAPLFALPTDFAAGWDQARWLGSNSSAVDAVGGGGLFLRPCATTEAHMLDVLHRQRQPPRAPVLGFGQQLARQAAALTGQPYDEEQQGDSAQAQRIGGASQQRRQQEEQQRDGGGDVVAVGAEQEFLAWCAFEGAACCGLPLPCRASHAAVTGTSHLLTSSASFHPATLARERRYFQYTGMTLPFDVYVINMDGAERRLAAFQRTFEASGESWRTAAAVLLVLCALQSGSF